MAAGYIDAIDAGLKTLQTGDARIVVLSELPGDANNVLWVSGGGVGWHCFGIGSSPCFLLRSARS